MAEKADKRILAIDADPAVGLATALGFRGERTVNDIRNDLIGRIEKGESENRQALLAALDYEVFAALEERENVAFLAIGRPEQEGCYCKVNSMLRDIIESVARNFDYVVIDGEAGIEQVNRRVLVHSYPSAPRLRRLGQGVKSHRDDRHCRRSGRSL